MTPDDCCSVCLEPLAVQPSGGGAVSILLCGHAFHRDCLTGWMSRADHDAHSPLRCYWKCPVCREYIVSEETPPPGARRPRCLCLDFADGGHAGVRLAGTAEASVVVVGLHGSDLARRAGLCLGARLLSVNGMACRHHAQAVGMIEAVRMRGRRCVLGVQLPRTSWLSRAGAFAWRRRRATTAG